MSDTSETVATLQERSAQATRQLCLALGLGTLKPADLKYLALALAQAATQEASRNPEFADNICSLYRSLLPRPKRTAGSRTSKAWQASLTPIGSVDDALIDPYAPPNPFVLQQIYGDDQLALALGRHTPAELKEAVATVQARYPNTKPKKLTKAGIIDYVVVTLTQQG